MKHDKNKGMILGITTVTMLVLLLIVSVVFILAVDKTVFYHNQNQDVLNRIELQRIAQEVYVNIHKDIELNNVQPSYEIENYGTVNINIDEDSFYYEIELNSIMIKVKISSTGAVDEWVIN